MSALRPWLVASCLWLGLAGWLTPVAAVYAQSSQGHAIVLVAGSNPSLSEQAALSGVLNGLNTSLTSTDRLGVILYSDIVEHVSALAPPSADEPARIERVLDALPAVTPVNTAVGIDRALELLSETTLQSSIIIIGELDVQLEDAVLQGRYTRWLDGILLPNVASEGIGLMLIAEQSTHQGLIQRFGIDTFASMAATGLDSETLSALALQHARTRVTQPTLSDTITTEALPTAIPQTSVATSRTAVADELTDGSAVPTETTASSIALQQRSEVAAVAVPAPQNATPGLIDRLSTLAMAPIAMLVAIVIGLVATLMYFGFGRRQRRASRKSRSHQRARPSEHQNEPLTQPRTTVLPVAGMADDVTLQRTGTEPDNNESRFDALIDSLSGGQQETLPVRSKFPEEAEDLTIETRTVNTARKRSATTADLTRELEDLTRQRNTQYDFD